MSELRRARSIDLFTGRGNELQRQTFEQLLAHPTGRAFRVVLPEPHPPAGKQDWTSRRERDIQVFDPVFGAGLLPRLIENNLRFPEQHGKAGLSRC